MLGTSFPSSFSSGPRGRRVCILRVHHRDRVRHNRDPHRDRRGIRDLHGRTWHGQHGETELRARWSGSLRGIPSCRQPVRKEWLFWIQFFT